MHKLYSYYYLLAKAPALSCIAKNVYYHGVMYNQSIEFCNITYTLMFVTQDVFKVLYTWRVKEIF